MENIFEILKERGFIFQSTSIEVSEKLKTPQTFYVGFDPTADTLHVGHLLPIMGMRWLQKAGHTPIALVGGATAVVGDPSGRTTSRPILTKENIESNCGGIRNQLSKFLDFSETISNRAVLVNNNDWLGKWNYLEFLREFGGCFNVNRMLSMDSMKSRLEGDGLSFLEFNYMILQAFDFLHLKQTMNCTFQFGGQDQWGNIVSGIELVRKKTGEEVFGTTFPLLLKSNGEKFGKSTGGAIWLDPAKTTPFDFFQFWRNSDDADVKKLLCLFTELPIEEIDQLITISINRAKEILAFEITKIVHGREEAIRAFSICGKTFGFAQTFNFQSSSDIESNDSISIPEVLVSSDLIGSGMKLTQFLVCFNFCPTTSDARRMIEGGAVNFNDQKITDVNRIVSVDDFHNALNIKVGKKKQMKIILE